MKTRKISDSGHPGLSPFVGLRDRKKGDTVVVEGEIAIHRALASPWPVTTVVGTASHLRRLGPSLADVSEVFEVESRLLADVTGFPFHRGCLAAMPRPAVPRHVPEAWTSRMAERGHSITVVAERLADPANLGSVIRCCRALGADLLVADAHGADPFSARAIRAAAGHCFTQPMIVAPSLLHVVYDLRKHLEGARVLAATVDEHATPIGERRRPGHAIVLLGTEGDGLSSPLRATADATVTIPMEHGVDSLNVAAATAILLWELGKPSRTRVR